MHIASCSWEPHTLTRIRRFLLGAALFVWAAVHAAAQGTPEPPSTATALPAGYTGKQIFDLACATCHGPAGTGSPRSIVGFDLELPDFTDCKFTTPEPLGDWFDGGFFDFWK
jgi:mono/diheme cytochrome c family protein